LSAPRFQLGRGTRAEEDQKGPCAELTACVEYSHGASVFFYSTGIASDNLEAEVKTVTQSAASSIW